MTAQQITVKNKYNRFLVLAAILFLINLIVFNDANSIWEGAETANLLKAQALNGVGVASAPSISALPDHVNAFIYGLEGLNKFLLRLPSICLLLLFSITFYFLGRKVFGQEAVKAALLVLGSSLLLVNLSKFVVNDIWLFVFQGFAWLSLILYLKQATNKWKALFWLSSLVGTWVSPGSMLIWVAGLWCYLYFLHPQGKRLAGIYIWLLIPVMYASAYMAGLSFGYTDGFVLRNGWASISEYFLYTGIAFIPWFGFLVAGLWDMLKKINRREELAIINLGALVLAMLSQSLILHLILAFITGKQMLGYQQKNYPYGNFVKTGALLALTLAFVAVTILMLQGYVYYEALGFRSTMTISGAYWVCAFIAVIGLFAKRRDMYIGGMAMSGLLISLFFWLQLGQLIESSRNLPSQLIKEALNLVENPSQSTLIISTKDYKENSSLAVYAQDRFAETQFIDDHQKLVQKYRLDKQSVYIMDKASWDAVLPVSNNQKKLKGSTELFGEEQDFWILR